MVPSTNLNVTTLTYTGTQNAGRLPICTTTRETLLLFGRPFDVFEQFGDIPAEEVGRSLRARDVARGEFIYRQGDHAQSLFVVESGFVALSRDFEDGRNHILDILGKGTVFGDLNLTSGSPRKMNAYALEYSILLEVPYEPVRNLLKNNPEIMSRAQKLLVLRMENLEDAFADFVFLDIPGRVANVLLQVAGEEDSFALPIKQDELAAMVGGSRERVNRAIQHFHSAGWIERNGRNKYTILDRKSLELAAGR